jgi:hypothetical protein
VTVFDFDELFVCSYDLQIGMWPNLFKNPSNTILSHGDILISHFHSTFQIKTYFDDFPSILKS